MDYRRELEKIEEEVNDKKLEKARLEERKTSLEKDKTVVVAELKELGLSEGEVEEWITKEEKALSEEIEKCKEILQTS